MSSAFNVMYRIPRVLVIVHHQNRSCIGLGKPHQQRRDTKTKWCITTADTYRKMETNDMVDEGLLDFEYYRHAGSFCSMIIMMSPSVSILDLSFLRVHVGFIHSLRIFS